DFMLLTAHEGIAEDGNVFFRNLSLGNLRGSYRYLGVAPEGLKPLIVRGMNREIERARAGQPAQLFMKMNSITDRDVIDKIVEACRAGVKVILVIRGITCIVDVDGEGDGLVIRQIVGRFLEHARVYAFGAEVDTVYLSSADMMTRNTEHRVEIAYPVLDPTCRALVLQYMNIQLADNVKARQLTSEGTWEKLERLEGTPRVDAQQSLIVLAYDRARKARENLDVPLIPEASVVPPIPEVLHGAPAREFLGHEPTEQEVLVVAESTESEDAVDEIAVEEAGPTEVFAREAKEGAGPVPSIISRAQERSREHREAMRSAVEDVIASTLSPEEPEKEEAEQPKEITPVSTTANTEKQTGRFSRAFKHFGAGMRALFRGE
ncbi:MAG: polyphosphate kinase 1, partial [Coriobacteriales bacterium]|nr:polyphosphate kinase 1 [Coriobacteriales bacterium]